MKTRKWSALLVAAMTALCMGSCSEDWGKMDPGAGNQVFPKLAKLETFNFDKELDPTIVQTFAYDGGEVAGIAKDDEHGDVLHMDGGYARLANPAAVASIQKAVGLTFWMKQTAEDLEGALFSFQNEDGTSKLSFSANGWLDFVSPNGSFDANNPADGKTTILPAGEWHFVAVSIGNEEYVVTVDGEEKIREAYTPVARAEGEGTIGDAILELAATAPYLYLGYGNDAETQELMLDDVTVYRNEITSKETAVPDVNAGDNVNYIIIGTEDNSDGFFAPKSNLWKLKTGETLTVGFYNFTAGAQNWENWVLVCTNGLAFGEGGYAEHFVLRADAYGWGDAAYSGDNISHDYNWDTFKTEINGAWVDLTVTRTSDNQVTMEAVSTMSDGTVRTYKFKYEAELKEEIGIFLTLEHAHLKIHPETVFVGKTYKDYVVGATDCSAGWWTTFSNLDAINGNFTNFGYELINGNTGAGSNWNNWVIVCTNGKAFGDEGYAEYFVLRSDAYGWGPEGGNYNGANITHGFNWDTFVKDMHNATVRIYLTRNSNRLDLVAKITKEDGTTIPDYTFFFEGITSSEVGFFFVLDGNYLDIRKVGYFPCVGSAK